MAANFGWHVLKHLGGQTLLLFGVQVHIRPTDLPIDLLGLQ